MRTLQKMKIKHKLELEQDYDFNVFAINSHLKAYKLCWLINKKTKFDFIKIEDHAINKQEFFLKYKHVEEGLCCYLLSNTSKKSHLIPSQKNVNFFLVVKTEEWDQKKSLYISSLRQINDILLVFEVELKKLKPQEAQRLIIHDKKN